MIPNISIQSNIRGLPFIAPECVLTAAILIILVVGISFSFRHRSTFTALSLLGLGSSLLPLWWLPGPEQGLPYLSDLFVWDWLTVFFRPYFALAGIFTVLIAHGSSEINDDEYSECVVLILAVTTGMMLLTAATDILMIFLAFETMGLLSYLLVGIRGRDLRGGEAALKYVLYGAFSSGIMLFGLSLLFGISGSTDLTEISRQLSSAFVSVQNSYVILPAVLFFLCGLLFKTASFPFHFWCPDVYEGAPTPVAAFLSVGPKAAGFALFIRMFYPLFTAGAGEGVFETVGGMDWTSTLALVSAITMTLGNLAAIPQNNLKRMLAYSSIAHAGYILMGIVALNALGLKAVVFYLVVYLFMNLGAFAVVAIVIGAGGSEEIHSYRGLGRAAPFTGAAMTIFLFSLIGLPPLAGFVGKLYLFAAVISGKLYWLVLVAALNTVVSLYYYLRVVRAMFFEEMPDAAAVQIPLGSRVLLGLLLVPTVGLGLYWQPLAEIVEKMF